MKEIGEEAQAEGRASVEEGRDNSGQVGGISTCAEAVSAGTGVYARSCHCEMLAHAARDGKETYQAASGAPGDGADGAPGRAQHANLVPFLVG